MARRRRAPVGLGTVSANTYRNRVKEHLRHYRPTEYKEAQRRRTLDRWIDDLAQSIADWVNSQLAPSVAHSSVHQDPTIRETARVFAEAEALREYLPRDEREEGLIGPSGGYED
jgi:hypothetical protein